MCLVGSRRLRASRSTGFKTSCSSDLSEEGGGRREEAGGRREEGGGRRCSRSSLDISKLSLLPTLDSSSPRTQRTRRRRLTGRNPDSLHLHSPTLTSYTSLYNSIKTCPSLSTLHFRPPLVPREFTSLRLTLCAPSVRGRAVGRCDLRPLRCAGSWRTAWATCCTLTVCLSNGVVSYLHLLAETESNRFNFSEFIFHPEPAETPRCHRKHKTCSPCCSPISPSLFFEDLSAQLLSHFTHQPPARPQQVSALLPVQPGHHTQQRPDGPLTPPLCTGLREQVAAALRRRAKTDERKWSGGDENPREPEAISSSLYRDCCSSPDGVDSRYTSPTNTIKFLCVLVTLLLVIAGKSLTLLSTK
ncbi:unnamed protein product [Pleuronectes platessa]|uniref:Uncharacterized protein n=1 Tax=Pleuronectes platessa TaxID=8262 RepID=A0A9N7VIC9_PLEPL|nr:unnamed protein product [Pleuronectes platessa]